MQMLGNKGQASNAIVTGLVVILIVSVVGIIGITVYNSIDSSLGTGLTGAALFASGNFTANTYGGYTLASVIPIVLAAGLILTVIIGFAIFARG